MGKSTGAEVDFFVGPGDQVGCHWLRQADFEALDQARYESGYPTKAGNDVLRIYTTRPDTLFGATYMVIAPEHPYVERLTDARTMPTAVKQYCEAAAMKSDLDRTELAKEKTGVFTGSYAIESGERRTGAHLDCGLRADQLRHGGHHGGPGAR